MPKSTKKFYTLTEYCALTSATVFSKTIEGLLREIYPDEKIWIHRAQGLIGLDSSIGDLVVVYFGRNVGEGTPATTDVSVKQSGRMCFWEMPKVIADTYWEFLHFDMVFDDDPIELDKDDNFNVIFKCPNVGAFAGSRYAELVLNIHYKTER